MRRIDAASLAGSILDVGSVSSPRGGAGVFTGSLDDSDSRAGSESRRE